MSLEQLIKTRGKNKPRKRSKIGLGTNYLVDMLSMVLETRSFVELKKITIVKENTTFYKYLKWCLVRQLIRKGKILPPNKDGKFVFYTITQRGKEFLELIK